MIVLLGVMQSYFYDYKWRIITNDIASLKLTQDNIFILQALGLSWSWVSDDLAYYSGVVTLVFNGRVTIIVNIIFGFPDPKNHILDIKDTYYGPIDPEKNWTLYDIRPCWTPSWKSLNSQGLIHDHFSGTWLFSEESDIPYRHPNYT